MRPLRVFLCHASQDKPYVLRLHRYLKQHGVQPWLDREELLPGQNWAVEISKALDASDVILVCLSKTSINKEGFVQKEISFALDKALEKPEGMIFIIPVKLEECELPRSLNRYHWVDLFREGGRKRLLMGLNRRATELGEDVTPVLLMEDTKQRTPKPSKPEIKREEPVDLTPLKDNSKEESKQETPARISVQKEEVKQEDSALNLKKEIEQEKPIIKPPPVVERKPFTKVLDPASLDPNGKKYDPGKKKDLAKSASKNKLRYFGIGGIILVCSLIVLFGGNYILNNLPATETPAPTSSTTLSLLTFTATKTYTPLPPGFTPALTPLGIGTTMISEKDGMVLVYVPAGEFLMGSTDGDSFARSNEKPQHTVILDAFWIDQTEVTNEKYALCVNSGDCESPRDTDHFRNTHYGDHPVVQVLWEDAKSYCLWAGRRLPTEAEWEKAARGTEGYSYPWGNEVPNSGLLNYLNKVGETTEVGSYPDGISPFGAFDMAGNAWEWVNDWYSTTYYQSSPSSNPSGPESGQFRVLRGGSWNNLDYLVRSAYRDMYDPSLTYLNYGFRCARSP